MRRYLRIYLVGWENPGTLKQLLLQNPSEHKPLLDFERSVLPTAKDQDVPSKPRFRAQHLVFQDQRVRMCVEMLEGGRDGFSP